MIFRAASIAHCYIPDAVRRISPLAATFAMNTRSLRLAPVNRVEVVGCKISKREIPTDRALLHRALLLFQPVPP
jgi:hypothetical protein